MDVVDEPGGGHGEARGVEPHVVTDRLERFDHQLWIASVEREAPESLRRITLDAIRVGATRSPFRPKVFFEEWDEPLISGIRWVEELVEIAGGDPISPIFSAPES